MGELEEIPIGWEVQRLGDFVIYQKGKKPKVINKIQSKDCSLPYVNIKAFEKNIIDEFTDGIGCVLCEDGDFLMVWDGARSGYIGKAIKGALGSTLVKITFPGINLDYAYYYLLSKYLQINTKAKGTGIPHVDPGLLWNYRFPIPPSKEQTRIVAKIEELFSDLDKGIESLKTAQGQLKTYRQSVLKYAFEGKLTNDNVKEGELPEGWKRAKLLDICDFITKGTTPPANKLYPLKGDVPFLKVYNLMFNGCLDFSINPTFVSVDTHKNMLARSKVVPGDVLMNIVGPPLGKVSIVPSSFSEWNINQAIVRFRCKEALLNKYLSSFLQADRTIRAYSRKAKATAGQFNLTLEICREIDIPLPGTLEEQQRIVSEIESRLSVCDKMEESITQSLVQAEALRQSILKKAFEGRLVPQDPDDESASILLERIRAEREKNKPMKAAKPRRTGK